MSNTYFKIEKESSEKSPSKDISTNTKMELSLTAFMGGDNHTQLTVQTSSSNGGHNGVGFIHLNDQEVDLLIAGLLERKLRKISATSDKQSIFSPYDED